MASPLKRTIQTAVESFTPALARPDVSLLLVPLAQEISAAPCDVGYEKEELEGRIENDLTESGLESSRVDYTMLEPGWSGKVR